MIPYLNHIICTYALLIRDINKEYCKLFHSLGSDILLHKSGFMYNWRSPGEYRTYGYTFCRDNFPLPENY